MSLNKHQESKNMHRTGGQELRCDLNKTTLLFNVTEILVNV